MKNKNQGNTHHCVTLEEVQKYMDYKLNPVELEIFEEKMETCDECLELVESLQKGIIAETMMKQEPELTQMEATVDYEQMLRMANNRRIGRRMMRLVGSIIVLFGIVWLLLPGSKKNEQPYTNKNKPLDSLKKQKQDVNQRNNPEKQIATPSVIDNIKNTPLKDTASRPIQVSPKKVYKKPKPFFSKQLSKAQRHHIKVWESKNLEVFTEHRDTTIGIQMNAHLKVQKITYRNEPEKQIEFFLTVYDSTNILKPMLGHIHLKNNQEDIGILEKHLNKLRPGTYYWILQNKQKESLSRGKFRKIY